MFRPLLYGALFLADDVIFIVEWLQEKVDSLQSRIKVDENEKLDEEEENMGDIDLFTLAEGGQRVVVNPKWLQHLQERLLGEDGHPRKVKDGEDPARMGLTLEWIFGSIVSTAEKARDSAKKSLGTKRPNPREAHNMLNQALLSARDMEETIKRGKTLLAEMLNSRKRWIDIVAEYPAAKAPAVTDGGAGFQAGGIELTCLSLACTGKGRFKAHNSSSGDASRVFST